MTVAAARCETNFLRKALFPPASACDQTMEALYRLGINYHRAAVPTGGPELTVQFGKAAKMTYEGPGGSYRVTGQGLSPKTPGDALLPALKRAAGAAGYPDHAALDEVNWPTAIASLFGLTLFAAMTFGPLAAYLVELFPTQVRYIASSTPYHIGNAVFGGFLPFFTLAIAVFRGDIFAGLIYPTAIAGATVIIGALFLPETHGRDLT